MPQLPILWASRVGLRFGRAGYLPGERLPDGVAVLPAGLKAPELVFDLPPEVITLVNGCGWRFR